MNEIDPIVFVVDDDEFVRIALRRLIGTAGFEVRTFKSAKEFLSAPLPDASGCLVLDVRMPGFSGLDLQQELAARNIDIPIIFLTGHGDIPTSVRAIKAGAMEFLTKPFNDQNLLAAIERCVEQHRLVRHRHGELSSIKERFVSLTPREREVFPLVTSGLLNKQIAAELGVTEKTIKIHRGQVMRKMRAGSLAELVHMAERLEITPSQSVFRKTNVL
jgi:FixJ family two-component response regulator